MKIGLKINSVVIALFFIHFGTSANASLDLKQIYFPEGRPSENESLHDIDQILGPEEQRTLKDLLQALKASPWLGAKVTGYADKHECEKSQCTELSLRRAKIVFDWFRTHGLPEAQLEGPIGESTDFPLYDGNTEEERQLNRRVYLSAYTVPQRSP